jgi:hypothetical protein
MRQRLAFIAKKQNDVASLGLRLAQLEPGANVYRERQALTQTNALNRGRELPTLQRVPQSPPAEVFFRSALDNCDRPLS